MDLRRQLRTARRWLPFTVIVAAIAGILAYGVLSTQPPVYEASATLKLGQTLSGSPILATQVSDRLLTEYAYRATSRATLADAASDLGLATSAGELQDQVRANVEPTSALLTVTAQAGSAAGAAELANAIGQELIATSEEAQAQSEVQQTLTGRLQALRNRIDATNEEIAALAGEPDAVPADIDARETELQTLMGQYLDILDQLLATGAHTLEFVSQASEPDDPVEPRPLLYTALAVFTGLLIAGAIVVVAEYFDDSLRDARDLEEATGLPLLGTLVELSGDARRGGDNRLVTVSSPRSPAAEEYRRLRANLELAAAAPRLQALLVTGSEPALGTSVTAANLAVAFAESGRRVVLVDGDFRRPEVHTFFRLPNEHGLSTLLEYESAPVEQVLARTRLPNLSVVASGSLPVNPTRALGSARLKNVLAQLYRNHDIVIFDSPPLPAVSDALVLASELHQTLLVVSQDKTRKRAVQQALDALSIAQADVIGTAFFRQRRGGSVAEEALPVAPAVGAQPTGPKPAAAQPQAAAQKPGGGSLGRPGSA